MPQWLLDREPSPFYLGPSLEEKSQYSQSLVENISIPSLSFFQYSPERHKTPEAYLEESFYFLMSSFPLASVSYLREVYSNDKVINLTHQEFHIQNPEDHPFARFDFLSYKPHVDISDLALQLPLLMRITKMRFLLVQHAILNQFNNDPKYNGDYKYKSEWEKIATFAGLSFQLILFQNLDSVLLKEVEKSPLSPSLKSSLKKWIQFHQFSSLQESSIHRFIQEHIFNLYPSEVHRPYNIELFMKIYNLQNLSFAETQNRKIYLKNLKADIEFENRQKYLEGLTPQQVRQAHAQKRLGDPFSTLGLLGAYTNVELNKSCSPLFKNP